MTEQKPILRTRDIAMSFGGVYVLKDIDFEFYPGEIHGLIGENGAGKSTLLKILAGVYQPKAGKIFLEDEEVEFPHPQNAINKGIALIHQEPLIFPDLDIAENIYIGRQPTKNGNRSIDWGTMYKLSEEILESLGVDLDPHTKVRGLSIADQQMVEMAGALSQDAQILLMDEPTAALTPSEVENLFKVMRHLREQGVALVFISHRLEEIFEICDRITVLRDGELIGERDPENTTTDEIIQMMVGRPLSLLFEKGDGHQIGEVVLEVTGLSRIMKFEDISFNIRAGEIVGVAGLVGAGRTDVARALFGVLNKDQGKIQIDGKEASIHHPRDAMAKGMIYVPEDRQHKGLLMEMSVAINTTLSVLENVTRRGWLREKTERKLTREYVEKLNIILRSIEQPVRELSGGNQQKVVLSKWLLTNPKILLLDEPTRGIDVGAKAEVHRLINELAKQGMAIFMISSELPEIMAMSDRIMVMREGRITAQFNQQEATAERIMAAATGQVLEKE